MAVDYKKVREEALNELEEEETKKMKHTYKNKLVELRNAKRVVKNLEREIEALDDKFAQKSEDSNG